MEILPYSMLVCVCNLQAEREAAKAAKAAEKAAAKAAKSAPKDVADEETKAVEKKSKAQKKAEAKEAKKKERPAPRVKEAPPQATAPEPKIEKVQKAGATGRQKKPWLTHVFLSAHSVVDLYLDQGAARHSCNWRGDAGKEDGRFKDAKIDSLEEKLKKRAELKIITK